MGNKFHDLFGKEKVLIGMLHLAGQDNEERVNRALEEAMIYDGEGFHGLIVEDYHAGIDAVESVLEALSNERVGIIRGVNVLKNPYMGFEFARRYGAKFIQMDTVQAKDLDLHKHIQTRREYPEIVVFGGIRFKYTRPTGQNLYQDVLEGVENSDVVVTTGDGTGIETPIEKLKSFREKLLDYPFVVGAGITDQNLREQLEICDGAIVGSYVKKGNTKNKVYRSRVKRLVDILHG